MINILIIDDEENIRSSLKSALDRRGYKTVTAQNYHEGLKFFKADFDLIFLDIMLPDGNGIDLLKEILIQSPDMAVVMISGHADISTAVEAIKTGAHDFIEKPISLEKVLVTIKNITKTKNLLSEKNRLESKIYGDFIGESKAFKELKNQIVTSAPKTSRFLIVGENGTGKELTAHMIHRYSKNAEGPFIAVNCAALPSDLVESELFGHKKGAFTGAINDRRGRFVEAENGTIFLDEIGEMPLPAQAKILRAIESLEITPVGSDKVLAINCNIIAASNKNIPQLITENKFREDLYYRLNVIQFIIPPLRERKTDIPILADYFLERFAFESGNTKKKLTAKAVKILSEYAFPGNVRELKNLMERLNIYSSKDEIDNIDITQFLPKFQSDRTAPLKEAVTDFELDYINSVIEANNGNITKAAQKLGIERSHLYKKLKKNQDNQK
ncbi:MAG: sigma-54 dependent transcriptional regulator [Candidatus Zixiibacteriota bacterium]